MKHTLYDGSEITDEELEKLADEYENDLWDGELDFIVPGRPPHPNQELKPVTVKLPVAMLQAIAAKGVNRSDFIRRAIAAAL
ncbi:hypothetical protein [Lancefieldella rimae]|uniref:hypothetical protein n=1 Tax=Lancefieldella rimae TaxID=1383 RepID=UPI001CB261D1|nr:hypothetical protein [Lancefieldella rimae]MBF4804145.1 pilus assembly protein HicB [Lancefieldella rimae]